jgi:hypothetical protein
MADDFIVFSADGSALNEALPTEGYCLSPKTDADFATLELPSGEELIAMVFDESLGGISLVTDAAWPLAVGSVVKIAYAGSIFTATVKHMRLLDDGVRRIVGFATAPR